MIGIELPYSVQSKFRSQANFFGADGTVPVRLNASRSVYAMGDSVMGINGTMQMVENTIGIQDNNGNVVYRTGPIDPITKRAKPFFSKPCGAELLWINSMLLRGGYLLQVGAGYDRNGTPYPQKKFTVARIAENPQDDPAQWKYSGVIWPSMSDQANSGFDACVATDSAFMWAFGYMGNTPSIPILARCSITCWDDGAPVWMFHEGGGVFGNNPENVEPLWGGERCGPCYDAHYDPTINKWVITYVRDIFGEKTVMMRFADQAWGYYSNPVPVFRPALANTNGVNAYNPKRHPQLGVGIWSINCNGYPQPNTYWPVFFSAKPSDVYKQLA